MAAEVVIKNQPFAPYHRPAFRLAWLVARHRPFVAAIVPIKFLFQYEIKVEVLLRPDCFVLVQVGVVVCLHPDCFALVPDLVQAPEHRLLFDSPDCPVDFRPDYYFYFLKMGRPYPALEIYPWCYYLS